MSLREELTMLGDSKPGRPFTPGFVVGDLVFLSGQGGFDPATGKLTGDSIEEQTDQTLRNVAAVLAQAGCTLEDVVSCLVHLADLDEYARFNAAYVRHFAAPLPVRTTVGAQLVLGMKVEITVIARRKTT